MNARRLLVTALAIAGLGACGFLAAPAGAQDGTPSQSAARQIQVIVDGGYSPSRIVVGEGERIRIEFLRRDYSPCTREVVFPSLGIRRELPTGKPVIVELPVLPPGEVEFRCGMNMLRGVIVVEPRG